MCSIIYELLISTISSYFLGDSVKQFSLIIGFYMAFMGVGSWLSRWIKKDFLFNFILLELILGIVGAFAIPLCYIYFGYADFSGFNIFIITLVGIIGMLTGLEIPLLTKILSSDKLEHKGLSDVLTLDYLGALVATLIFPFILIPFMGVYKSSLLFGFINISIGVCNFILFRRELDLPKAKKTVFSLVTFAAFCLIILSFFRADEFVRRWNQNLFKYPVIYEQASAYQNIVLTKSNSEFRLYLNGAIQFSSRDEYRYHEALVHVAAQNVKDIEKVLILGGGEGLAAREVLKYNSVNEIDLVDLDPAVTKLASENQLFVKQNKGSLRDKKVQIYNEDAFRHLMNSEKYYDLIIIDLPDPTNEALAKLYSIPFYKMIKNHLNFDGLMVTQATSPELSPKAFWSINKTINEAGLTYITPIHVNVPSFGNWGFLIAGNKAIDLKINDSEIEMEFLDAEILDHMTYFPMDVTKFKENVESNTLDRPKILDYYLEHWQSLQTTTKK